MTGRQARADDAHLRHALELIARIGTGMLTTRDRDGHAVSRPVATLRAGAFDGNLWFFTSVASHKASEVRARPQVNVAYASPRDNRFVSVSGLASVRRDRRRIAALWTPAQRVYFPGGPDHPDLTLLRVRVATIEYWDGPASLVGRALRFAVAAATGNADATGDNRTLALDGDGRHARQLRGNTRGAAGRVERDTGRPKRQRK